MMLLPLLPLLLLMGQAAASDDPPPPPPAPVETLHKIVVDAIRNCPEHAPDELVVCAKDRGIAEGYRIPKMDSRFAKTLRPSGRGEVSGAAVGATGIGSCTKSGPGGAIGCSRDELKAWAAQRKAQHPADPPRGER